jgi:predicted dehydrogenase
MDTHNQKALVAGCGSIGQRHLRNLRTLGIERLSAYDPDPARVASVVAELLVQGFPSFDQALEEFQPNLVFVCSPPCFHVDQAVQAIRKGADVFIEKPLSDSLDQVTKLIDAAEAYGRIAQVGYNLRFHPGMNRLKQIVIDGIIGPILWARAEVGHYLPNWRPWQDYRQSYTAQRHLGGGVIFDLSHEIDYITWMLGDPVQLLCLASHTSSLALDVEDSASILLRFPSGAHADLHMDCIQRRLTRVCKLVGENGTVHLDAVTGVLNVLRADGGEDAENWSSDPNDSYIAEVRHFLECVRRRSAPLVNLKQAARVVELCLMARDTHNRPGQLRV